MTARLHAARHPGEVTAAAALAWFSSAPGRGEVIGYLFAPDRAEWFRCDGAFPLGPALPRDLAAAYELAATDGAGQLRWVHRESGTGPAVAMSEDTARLPQGDPVSGPERNRLEGTATRLLAGTVIESSRGWSTLGSARYARCEVPVAAQRGQRIWAGLAEYAVTDEHGNVCVIDTLLLGLTPRVAQEGARP